MTVGQLLAGIDSRELAEWAAYERMHGPLGQQRDDQLTALVASTVANAFRDGGKVAQVSDFLPTWSDPAGSGYSNS